MDAQFNWEYLGRRSFAQPNDVVYPSPDMEVSVRAVERILGYSFKNKRLLEEALTHSSCSDSLSNFQRLEFVGDAAIGLAISNYVFLAYPQLDPGQLTSLRSANISTEKLARVAVRHGLYPYVRRNVANLDDKVREFDKAVREEDEMVVYGGSVKAPKILADIVESIAAAVYVDVNFDLQRLWVIFRGLLEPIITYEDLHKQPQPVRMLFELCQKQGKHVDIKYWRDGSKNIASVHIDGNFVASGSAEKKEIAKLNAAKLALHKLPQAIPVKGEFFEYVAGVDGCFEIEGAKHKLHEICRKKKWTKPIYKIENNPGTSHEKGYVSSVQVATTESVLFMMGDERSKIKNAESSAASLMISALQECGYL
ncbi:ribonuclease 3-like protein 2 isoform X1 [Ziziphus jujuba]|uniref:Ribonuclease 3-like protein 2 isoform X1 n=1 Tax=Ziziphus jujuba TaxID=326968 RepID=A0A6P4AU28_ZIZJJ|nr:ribonuclease 3-like protein 2 isoform X1 [Ziziphus jujuba]XP_048323021.1 ribonuclease 3-like protein 2 isoform X2 [Ziziphus jujuba var. spinosa]